MTGVVIEVGDVAALLALPERSVLLDRRARVWQLSIRSGSRVWRSDRTYTDRDLAAGGPFQLLWHAATPAVPGDVSRETSAPVDGPHPLDARLVELGRRVILRRRVTAPDDVPVQVEGVFVYWRGGEFVGSLDRDAVVVLDHDGTPGEYLARHYDVVSAPVLSPTAPAIR